ncbi:MAG: hypothetical protein ACE5EG_10150, partial [Thermoanaerobaculia bacterium]
MRSADLRRALVAASAVALVIAGGCRGPRDDSATTYGPAELIPIPEPDVSSGDPKVGEQIQNRLARIEKLAQDPGGAAEFAQAYGDLGLVFIAYDFLEAARVCFENS